MSAAFWGMEYMVLYICIGSVAGGRPVTELVQIDSIGWHFITRPSRSKIEMASSIYSKYLQ
jgi:hypothetical protein